MGLRALKASKSYLIDLMVKSQGLSWEKIGKVGREGQEKLEPAVASGFKADNCRVWERRQELGPTSLLGYVRGTGENVSKKILFCVMNKTSLELCFALQQILKFALEEEKKSVGPYTIYLFIYISKQVY